MGERWTNAEMYRLASSGAHKCARDGIRGPTLVSTEELRAMSAVLIASGALLTEDQLKEVTDATTVDPDASVTETPKGASS